MLKRSTVALFLCLPLCAFAAGGSLFHSSSATESSAEVTTWRGERALRIPVELSASDWSKAGFAATSTAQVQTAWLYLTETMFQLQDGAGHALMGGPRSDLELEVSQCIRMRSLTVSVCANSTFPATKEARDMLHGSARDFSWLYYHLAQAGHVAAGPAPRGTMLATTKGSNSSAVAAPMLECRLVNPDGSPATEQPVAAQPAPTAAHAAPTAPMVMASEPTSAPAVVASTPMAAPAAPAAPATPVAAVSPVAPAVPVANSAATRPGTSVMHIVTAPVTEAASIPTPAKPAPAPAVDHAQSIRAMAAASHPALMDAATKQPASMLEANSTAASAVPAPALPIHVHAVEAPVVAKSFVVAGIGHMTNRANVPFTAANTTAPAPVQPKPVVTAFVPKPSPTHSVAAAAPVEEAAAMADTSSDDLTPAGAPRGVVPESRARVKAAAVAASKPVDQRTALLQAEKAARAARLAEMQMKSSPTMAGIPESAEVNSVPVEKPRSAVDTHITTSTAFSKPAYSEPVGTPAIRNLAGAPTGAAFADVTTVPTPGTQNAAPTAGQEIAQATENAPVHKRHIERPAFKSAGLPTVIDNEQ